MAELLLGSPLFPGESGVDQLVEIIKVGAGGCGWLTREETRARRLVLRQLGEGASADFVHPLAHCRAAQVLGSTGFLDETHATMHLNAKRGNVDGTLGTPALDHRNHQVGKSLPFLALDFIRIAVGVILRRRRHIGQCPHGLDA